MMVSRDFSSRVRRSLSYWSNDLQNVIIFGGSFLKGLRGLVVTDRFDPGNV